MPATKTAEYYSKRVEFVAKDESEQVATGIVMVPDTVDLQGDFARPDTIRGFADQFGALKDTGDAGGGIMHAAWPDEWISLEENRVLEEAATIGGATVGAGAWAQQWHFDDAELWSLVEDGILEGYSIGAVDIEWSAPMDREELPDDVAVAEDYPDDGPFWELRDGIVREVSAVDIPAVPDAMILETKAGADKRLADYLGNRDGFIEEALDRGHSEGEAERLWDVLTRASELDGSGTPGKQSFFSRVGKAVFEALPGGTDVDVDKADTSAGAGPGDAGSDASKEGRTLSRRNRNSLFASIDAQLGVLNDAGVDHGATRFTDREDIDFDIAEFDGKAAPTDKDVPGDDTPDSSNINMSDDDPFDDAPDWAKELHREQQKNSQEIDSLAEKVDGDSGGTGGDGGDPSGDKAWNDAPEWAKQLREEQKENREQIEHLAEASGKSQQLSGGDGGSGSEGGSVSKADILGLPGGEA